MRVFVGLLLISLAGPVAAQKKEPAPDKKKAQCASYTRQLESNTDRARKGGSAAQMERLNEERRKVSAAQRTAGC